MKEQISELMDGELDDDHALRLMAKIRHLEEGHEWCTYHLIGDVLRDTPAVSCDFVNRLNTRLIVEPTLLAPNRFAKGNRAFALSAAASVAAVSLVVWAVMHTGTDESSSRMLATPQAQWATVSINPYLQAHQEYSPSIAMQGNIHTVAEVRGADVR